MSADLIDWTLIVAAFLLVFSLVELAIGLAERPNRQANRSSFLDRLRAIALRR